MNRLTERLGERLHERLTNVVGERLHERLTNVVGEPSHFSFDVVSEFCRLWRSIVMGASRTSTTPHTDSGRAASSRTRVPETCTVAASVEGEGTVLI